jgi:hypothetical protein
MATATETVTNTEPQLRLRLVGERPIVSPTNIPSDQLAEQSWIYATPYDPDYQDPDRYAAANDPDWDYSQGNPINPMWQGQRTEDRDNHSPRTYFLFRGVNMNGVCIAFRTMLSAY